MTITDTVTSAAISAGEWVKRFNSYGALITTLIIFGLFWEFPKDDTTKALALLAAGFWLGSSNSSQKKDEVNAEAMRALAVSVPPNGTH